MPSLAHLAAIERLSEELQGVRPGVSARKVALARPAPAPAAPRTHAALRAAVRPGSGRELAPRPLPSAAKRPRLPTTPGPVAVSHNVSTSDVIAACRAICARDPVVKGKRAALQATAEGGGITSALRDDVLRRWETCKLLALLPASAIQRLSGLSHAQFRQRDPFFIAQFLLAKGQAVAVSTLANARRTLVRLTAHLARYNIPWDGLYGHLAELDLFGFLMEVHMNAVQNARAGCAGDMAVWGAYGGLTVLNTHFRFSLPLHAVKSALPRSGRSVGPRAILNGALPLPPEMLQDVLDFISRPSTPPVLRSWGFALAFTALSSLRQNNAQHLVFYGEITVLGKDFLVSHHADGKTKDKMPVVFVTPLQDFRGKRTWFDRNVGLLWPQGDFLWAQASSDPCLSTSTLLHSPLDEGQILSAMHLVLRLACKVPLASVQGYTKQSARKMLVSAAQAGGVPWECCIELGHWSKTSLDSSFLLPAEDVRRKRALECISMPRRYSHNARLARVARIVGNQVSRISTYLALRARSARGAKYDTQWELMPQYCALSEGA